jgi:phosphate transport system protein
VASDLRFIVACLKIENDLERIADLAANIAERAVSLSTRAELVVPMRIRDMVEHCARMLRHSIDAFVRGDAELARRICAEDAEVDRANRLIIQELLEAMHANPACIDQAVELISVSKNLERIGDHATNIAEDVVYLVEGDIIRHRSKGRAETRS